jgi:[protein-PII] uridylyltransferase
MALSGASIVDAKIVTLTNGMALDSFTVQDSAGDAFDGPERLRRLRTRMDEVLSGRINIRKELDAARARVTGGARARAFHVAPRVLIDNQVSRQHTVIEVNGRDRPGLLYDVTAALTQLGLQIASAHISTFGERVVDVFYVKDIFGLRVERREHVERIRAALLDAVSEPPSAPAVTASAAE